MSLDIRSFVPADEAAVIELWRDCGLVVPWNDPCKDVARKRAVQPELLLVGRLEEPIVAALMAGYDGHRGWLNYLAVAPAQRGRGFGRALVAEAERRLLALGCPKINLQIRETNAAVIAFYERCGYQCDPVLSMGKRLISDD